MDSAEIVIGKVKDLRHYDKDNSEHKFRIAIRKNRGVLHGRLLPSRFCSRKEKAHDRCKRYRKAWSSGTSGPPGAPIAVDLESGDEPQTRPKTLKRRGHPNGRTRAALRLGW